MTIRATSSFDPIKRVRVSGTRIFSRCLGLTRGRNSAQRALGQGKKLHHSPLPLYLPSSPIIIMIRGESKKKKKKKKSAITLYYNGVLSDGKGGTLLDRIMKASSGPSLITGVTPDAARRYCSTW